MMVNDNEFPNELKLSSRELEIIQLANAGFTTKAIAKKLNISRHTAETLQLNIKIKLGGGATPPGSQASGNTPRTAYFWDQEE
jgi:DNA-binding NarL/FixJ family response regulator